MVFLFPVENGRQRLFLALAVVFAVIPTLVVCLRVYALRLANRRLILSDWLMIAATAILVVYQGTNISAVLVGGLGLHLPEIMHRFGVTSSQESFTEHLLALHCLWCIVLALAKLSLLSLYSKVFEVRSFVIASNLTAIFIVLWALSMIIGSAMICQPLAFYWDHDIPGGFCGDSTALFLVTGVLNLVTDLIVLLLPMPYLYGLSMALYKRLVLMGTFSLGLLTCIISAARIWVILYDFRPLDPTYSTVPTALLSQLEPSLLITLGCIPLLRPLLGGTYSRSGTASGHRPDFAALGSTYNNNYIKRQSRQGQGQQQSRLPGSTIGDNTSETELRLGGGRAGIRLPERVATTDDRGRGSREEGAPSERAGPGEGGGMDIELGMIVTTHTRESHEAHQQQPASVMYF